MKKLIYTLLLILTSAVCFSNGNNIHTIYSFAKTQLNKALDENSNKVLRLSK